MENNRAEDFHKKEEYFIAIESFVGVKDGLCEMVLFNPAEENIRVVMSVPRAKKISDDIASWIKNPKAIGL